MSAAYVLCVLLWIGAVALFVMFCRSKTVDWKTVGPLLNVGACVAFGVVLLLWARTKSLWISAETYQKKWSKVGFETITMLVTVITAAIAILTLTDAAEANQKKQEEKDKFAEAKAVPSPSALSRFVISQSAVHKTGKGAFAHTFLLDQISGEVWQMVCAVDGRVAFEKVRTAGLPRPDHAKRDIE